MCGRYYIESEDSTLELLAIIDEVNRKSKAGPVKMGEIFPTDVAPVIANNRSQKQAAFTIYTSTNKITCRNVCVLMDK